MSNTLIQQSLVDIEQNLKKLESARDQVGNLADKSSQLITSIASVIKSIEAIREGFNGDENYLKNSVHKSMEEFSQSLSKGAENANKKASDLSFQQEKTISASINHLTESINNSIGEFDKKFIQGVENANRKTAEISSNHENKIQSNIDKIEEFQSNLNQVQKSILEFDLEKSLDKIRAELITLSESINSKHDFTANKLEDLKMQTEQINSQHLKTAKTNIIVVAAGFIFTIIVILITR